MPNKTKTTTTIPLTEVTAGLANPTITQPKPKQHKWLSRAKYWISRHRYTAFVILAVIALVLPHVVNAEQPIDPKDDPKQNYCKDAEKNAAWSKMFSQHPLDPAVVKLYALRSGLCVMIDTGMITLDNAVIYFDEEWNKFIIEREEREKNKQKLKIQS
jgi:hypothetical protein